MLQRRTTEPSKAIQTAFSSLLESDDIPDISGYPWNKQIHKLLYLITYMDCIYNGCLFNPGWCGGNSDLITSIFAQKGVKGFFMAIVKHIKPNEGNHMVIVDREFNIVNPILDEYKGVTAFPRHKEVGYNGIKQILLIQRKIQKDV